MPTDEILITPTEFAQAIVMPGKSEREMRRRNRQITSARRRHKNGMTSDLYRLSEGFEVALAWYGVSAGVAWPRAREIAAKALEGLRHFAAHGVAPHELTPLHLYMRPPGAGGRQAAPDFILARAEAVDPAAIAAQLNAGAILITLPLAQVLDHFCAQLSAVLGVTVTPDDVLAAPTQPTVAISSSAGPARNQ